MFEFEEFMLYQECGTWMSLTAKTHVSPQTSASPGTSERQEAFVPETRCEELRKTLFISRLVALDLAISLGGINALCCPETVGAS